MVAKDIRTRGWRPSFFVPALRQNDKTVYYEHMESTLSTTVVSTINVPKGVNALLVQAITQNIRYTLTPAADPSQTSGFRLTAGNDPIVIPALDGMEVKFIAEAAGAELEMQFGTIL